MRLIDAEKLEKDGWSASRTYQQGAKTTVYETKKMTDFPTSDVVEVVRCKDCIYGHRLTDANGYNYRTCNYPWGHGMMVDEYGFCKWGERREDDAEVH